ncbi:hypothetical protein PFICI_09298 [Pestalotiopsis fici W106-1]|uniref:DUF7514 domain-containing protein n=1 Tax=Pestalotiopsis fici (strain W106-1 / CGMCC3.15140) TaxID=1229662 RepID=W3X018_PESFW|nr:uncharacterized protein PFICI_09298 [Pestalotiopsis fici W106-1]ETS79445.1 hypothetical protein PFICI_09298 [Pestalotiopsis fici W106-1]
MNVPPPIPPRPPGYELRTPANPPLPPRPGAQQQQGQYIPSSPPPQTFGPRPGQGSYAGPPGQPSQWSDLHYPDGTPTPLFEQFMAVVFAHLDPQKTGYIWPETLSNFLDLSEFEENVWKSNLKGNIMYTPEDIADAELKWTYEAWSFDHKATTRSPGRQQFPFGGLPLLSLRGFTDMMALEYASDPMRGHRGLNVVLTTYRIWPHLGPLPRSCLPAAMPDPVRRRVAAARRTAEANAREILDANQARLRIEAQGRQYALELLDPPYVRRYYY